MFFLGHPWIKTKVLEPPHGPFHACAQPCQYTLDKPVPITMAVTMSYPCLVGCIFDKVFVKAIKSHLCSKLNLKTLDALMRVSLCWLEVDALDWAIVFNIWRNMQDQMLD